MICPLGTAMPRDLWRKDRDKQHMRRAQQEYASGRPSSYERVSDEIIPIHKLRLAPSRAPKSKPSHRLSRPTVKAPPSPVADCLRALESPDSRERSQAQATLERVSPHDLDALAFLLKAQAHRAFSVRVEVENFFTRRSPSVLPTLIELLGRPEVSREAERMLVMIGKAAVPVLSQAKKEQNTRIRSAAARILQKI